MSKLAKLRENPREALNIGLAKGMIIFWGFVFGFPIYYSIVGSTMTRDQVLSYPPKLTPAGHLVSNYGHIIFDTRFLDTMVNSSIFAIGVTLGIILLSAPAGFAFEKYDFKGKRTALILILTFIAVPFQLISIPLFKFAVDIGFINTFHGTILPAMAAPIGVFFMKQNVEQVIADDLLNSARVDGASELQVFYRIVLPLIRPGIIALGLYLFLLRFKSYYWPLIMLRNNDVQVAQVWIAKQIGSSSSPTPYEILLPAGVIVSLPLLIVFLFGQKYIVQGLTRGALKE
jgi:ABC-type glycerol-3-phosphate transport system permease component